MRTKVAMSVASRAIDLAGKHPWNRLSKKRKEKNNRIDTLYTNKFSIFRGVLLNRQNPFLLDV